MANEFTPEAVELLNTIASAMNGKKKKEKKAKGKYVLIVNGKVTSQLASKVKEVEDAARVLTLQALAKGQEIPSISYATVTNTVKIDVPVTSTESDSVEVN